MYADICSSDIEYVKDGLPYGGPSFLYIFYNLFANNLLTMDSDSDNVCLEGVSTRKS